VGWFGALTDKIGKASYDIGTFFEPYGKSVAKLFGHKDLGAGIFARRYIYASIAYTPYFYMKTDTGIQFWDNQQMNASLDRMVHGMFHGNWNDFTGGWNEYWRTVKRKPLTNPERIAEVESRRAYEIAHGRSDNSPAPPQWWIDRYYHATQAKPDAEHDHPSVAEPAAFQDRERRDSKPDSVRRTQDSWAEGVRQAQAQRLPQQPQRSSSHTENEQQRKDTRPPGATLH
jgi:hypothetical protein